MLTKTGPVTPCPEDMDPAEWAVRIDLAALYRLVALEKWDDLIFTHISARVPGPEGHFLINPYGDFFEEITASSLVKVDGDGNLIKAGERFINPAGFTIHSAVHSAQTDAHFVIHLHAEAMCAVAAQAEGLLPLTQTALLILPQLSRHRYEGIALNLDERARIVDDLGDKKLMLLDNHGGLAIGQSAAEAWTRIYFLERACRQQIMALSAGRDGVLIAPDAAQAEVKQQSAGLGFVAGLLWPACLRRLDRVLPGYGC